MNKKYLVPLIAFIIVVVSSLIPSPFLPNCNIFGCIYGQGWPLPFYYSQYCSMGDVGCKDNYISASILVIDTILIAVILFLVLLIFNKFFKHK